MRLMKQMPADGSRNRAHVDLSHLLHPSHETHLLSVMVAQPTMTTLSCHNTLAFQDRKLLAKELLREHEPLGAPERRAVRDTLHLLGSVDDPFSRATMPGHITGSAVVLDSQREHVLVIWHERLGRWLQPGGHSEPDDASPLATAVRELAEETGVDVNGSSVDAPLVHVDVHEIPAKGAEPAHRHHDFRFAFVIPSDLVRDDTGHRVEWVGVTALASRGADDSLRAAVSSALRRLA